MFNLNHLYYFYVVAGEGSVSAASRKLRLSQPALSVQIKSFEESVGQRLFSRSSQGLQRTAAGDLVYRYASQIFGLTDELQELLRVQSRTIRVGVAEGIERPFSVHFVRLLLDGCAVERRPHIQLVAESHESLLGRFRSGGLDAILSDRGADRLHVLGSYQMPVVAAVAASPAHEKLRAGLNAIDLRTLGGAGLVLPSIKFLLREEIERYLRARSVPAAAVLECDMLASVVRGVLDGVGVGFLPLPYIQEAVQQGKLWISDPTRPLWQHSLHLLADEELAETPVLAELQTAFGRWRREMEGEPLTSPAPASAGG